jgi:putative FmdB family regulatory protein
MPIFDYQCRKCGHQFDVLQKLGEAPLRECPECAQSALEKLVSTPAFQVKGKGGAAPATRARVGHNLDNHPPHSHDHGHGHSHSHSHGGHTHSHGPGCGHKH